MCMFVCVCTSIKHILIKQHKHKPVMRSESCVCIILVTMVSSKNCPTISLEFVLGDVAMRLLWWIPVQLHYSRSHYQMSGLRPNT